MDNLETLVQEKLDADTDFNATLADLSDEDKSKAIATKKSEIINSEFKSLADKAKEADKKFQDQQARAKKLEDDAKKNKPVAEGLSQDDLLFIAKSNIHEDDLDEVKDFMAYKKISAKDALKNESLKAVLAHNAELRKSAEAASAKPTRPAAQKLTDEAVVNDAMNNDKIPEKGSDEADKLFWARRGGKR